MKYYEGLVMQQYTQQMLNNWGMFVFNLLLEHELEQREIEKKVIKKNKGMISVIVRDWE